jgi:hypothetical protein
MKTLGTIASAALLGAGVLIASIDSASAYVVCNRWGECWRTTSRYQYAPGLRVRFYDDAWWRRHHRNHRWHWRNDHEGRGYWRHGVWITF